MTNQIESLIAESNAQVVATIEGRPVTRGELSEAFDWVADRSNWKNPIACAIVLSARQRALVREAIVFFTGSIPTITVDDGDAETTIVRAAGYYATIGA